MSALPPSNGWHLREWWAEFVGTGVLLFAVVTAKDMVVRAGPPLSDRLWLLSTVGVVAGLVVAGWAFTPFGRRSGAHLNPAVTFGLWCQKVVGAADLAGYAVAQTAGGIVGVLAARVWGVEVAGPRVDWATIRPASWLPEPVGAVVEAAATAVQVGVVFALLTNRRRHGWAPVVGGALLAVSIVGVAPVSGAGFNPARGLAPDVVAASFPAVWIYLAGPLAGAAVAAAALVRAHQRPVTGKLHHDATILCHMRCNLPHKAPAELLALDRNTSVTVDTPEAQTC